MSPLASKVYSGPACKEGYNTSQGNGIKSGDISRYSQEFHAGKCWLVSTTLKYWSFFKQSSITRTQPIFPEHCDTFTNGRSCYNMTLWYHKLQNIILINAWVKSWGIMHRQNKPSAQLPQPTRSQMGKWEEFWDWTPISPGELIRQSPYCPGQGHYQQEVLSAHCSR